MSICWFLGTGCVYGRLLFQLNCVCVFRYTHTVSLISLTCACHGGKQCVHLCFPSLFVSAESIVSPSHSITKTAVSMQVIIITIHMSICWFLGTGCVCVSLPFQLNCVCVFRYTHTVSLISQPKIRTLKVYIPKLMPIIASTLQAITHQTPPLQVPPPAMPPKTSPPGEYKFH